MHESPHPAWSHREIWLEEAVWQEPNPARIAQRLIDMLCDSGIPLLRVNIAVATLHPELVGFANIWRRSVGRVESFAGDRTEVMAPENWDRSPFRLVDELNVSAARRRLDRDDCLDDLDILADMRAEGATDYVIITQGSSGKGDGTLTTWTTDRPGGFTTPELVAIAEHVRLVSHVYTAIAARKTSRTLIETYIGRRASERILAGNIVRGRSESLEAAIWMSDIRDFTGLSERLPAAELLALLNRHFDSIIAPVQERGGDALKLIGDAVLAVFPGDAEGGAAAACAAALDAAKAALAVSGSAIADDEAERLRFVVALHYGTVSYGNVGASNRLDFTVIGPAVNLASRLNGLGKFLDRKIILSDAFAAHCTAPTEDLGRHTLRGLAGQHAVFAPAGAAP